MTRHAYDGTTGDVHVYLWFGSLHFDPQVEHVTVFSTSSGNAEAGEALERPFETYFSSCEEPTTSRLPSEPVTVTANGEPGLLHG